MKKYGFFECFIFGAVCYPLIEIIWRGKTHPTMAAAGGFSVIAIEKISKLKTKRLTKCLVSSAAITSIELLTGLIFNKKNNIWDYTEKPFNYKGQICLLYSLYWCILSYPAIMIFEKNSI